MPFLYHHLVEYALVPRALKVEGTSGKRILKRALEGILPHDLLYSPKRGFGAPIREWFRNGLGASLDARLMNSSMRRRDFFDYSFIARLLEEHRRGAHDWSFHLWCLLNLSLWYERWMIIGIVNNNNLLCACCLRNLNDSAPRTAAIAPAVSAGSRERQEPTRETGGRSVAATLMSPVARAHTVRPTRTACARLHAGQLSARNAAVASLV